MRDSLITKTILICIGVSILISLIFYDHPFSKAALLFLAAMLGSYLAKAKKRDDETSLPLAKRFPLFGWLFVIALVVSVAAILIISGSKDILISSVPAMCGALVGSFLPKAR
jgi:predicted membrane protein